MRLMVNAGPRKNWLAFEKSTTNCIIREVLILETVEAMV